MVANAHEQSVWIATDSRTWEQLRTDFLNNLQSKLDNNEAHQLGQNAHGLHSTEYDWQGNQDWHGEVNRWLSGAIHGLHGYLHKAEQRHFTLLPLASKQAQSDGSAASVLQLVENQLATLRLYWEEVQPKLLNLGSARASLPLLENQDRDALDFLWDAYEPGENNQVIFRARFDVRGFDAHNLQVLAHNNQLTVQGKLHANSAVVSNWNDFSRTVYLPNSVQHDKLLAILTSDGVLVVRGPVHVQNLQQFAVNGHAQLALRPQQQGAASLKLTGTEGLSVQKASGNQSKLHLEVAIEAGFNKEDLLVFLGANHLYVSGRQQHSQGANASENSLFKEFIHKFNTPETLDLLSLHVEVQGNHLLLEAPLLKAA